MRKTDWIKGKNTDADDFTKKLRNGIWKTKDKSSFRNFDDYVKKATAFFPDTLLIQCFEYNNHFSTKMKRAS